MDLSETKDTFSHRHPWELSRADSIFWLMRKNNLIHSDWHYADIGAGDLFIADRLSELTFRPVHAIDSHFHSLEKSAAIVMHRDTSEMEDESADCVLMLDVLEHVEEDDELLSEARRILRPGGAIVITVPAIQALFTGHDRSLGHYRRYSRRQLQSLLADGRFNVALCHYFYTSLVLPRLIEKLMESLFRSDAEVSAISGWEHEESGLVTKAIRRVLNADFLFNHFVRRFGLSLPGLSVCAVARKI